MTGLVNRSANGKTGPMAQTWIVPTDEGDNLLKAVAEGRDRSVCGDCRHRPAAGNTCYVQGFNTYQRVIHTYLRGRYPVLDPQRLDDEEVRWGSWGDPAAVPLGVYQPLLPRLRAWTGYTHLWRGLDSGAWASWLMASVDTRAERAEARRTGWRTFRVLHPGERLEPGEQPCPASRESLHLFTRRPRRLLTCLECRKCDGYGDGGTLRPDIGIVVHGNRAGRWPNPAQLGLFDGR